MDFSPTVEETFERYLVHCQARGLADKTIQSYKQQFRSMQRFIDCLINIEELSKEHLAVMISQMREYGLKSQTIITITKDYAKRAGVFGSDAYEEFKAIRADHHNFKIKTQPTSRSRQTHKGLDRDKMRQTIVKSGNAEKLAIFDRALADKVPYPTLKAWFLKKENFENYVDIQKSKMPDNAA